MSSNYFQGTPKNPYHISIGAVVMNDKGLVCCHYFEKITHQKVWFENFYILMRETPEPHETIEVALKRGLMEEFGMEASLEKYIGSIVAHFPKEGVMVEKTTLYFLCNFISIDETKRKVDDIEATSQILWLDPLDLIVKMKEQGVRLQRKDIDESSILERLASTSH